MGGRLSGSRAGWKAPFQESGTTNGPEKRQLVEMIEFPDSQVPEKRQMLRERSEFSVKFVEDGLSPVDPDFCPEGVNAPFCCHYVPSTSSRWKTITRSPTRSPGSFSRTTGPASAVSRTCADAKVSNVRPAAKAGAGSRKICAARGNARTADVGDGGRLHARRPTPAEDRLGESV